MYEVKKETIGCLGVIAVLFLLVGLMESFRHKPPPMSDSEMHAIIAKMKESQRQKCIDIIRSTEHLWPKDMEKEVGKIEAKCAEDSN